MTSRLDQLREELARESVTNIEFERSSRRSIESLAGQVRTLREAFDALSDGMFAELDHFRASVRSELWRFDEWQADFERTTLRSIQDTAIKRLEEKQAETGKEALRTGQEANMRRLEERLTEFERSILKNFQEVAMKQLTDRQADIELKVLRSVQDAALRQVEERHAEAERGLVQNAQEAAARRCEKLNEAHEKVMRQWQTEMERRMLQDLENATRNLTKTLEQHEEHVKQVELKEQDKQEDVERRLELVSRDLATVLGTIPGIEDTMLKAHMHLQEKISAAMLDLSLTSDAVAAEKARNAAVGERLESRLEALEVQLREELQQRHLRLQRSLSRQLEGMSRAMVVGGERPSPVLLPSEDAADVRLGSSGARLLGTSPQRDLEHWDSLDHHRGSTLEPAPPPVPPRSSRVSRVGNGGVGIGGSIWPSEVSRPC